MASTIKVDTIDTPDGTGNITVSRPLSGSGASLTSLPAANLTGTLPAIDGSNLTGIGLSDEWISVYRNTTQSIPDSTNTQVQFNAETADPSSDFDSSSGYDYVVPTTGRYLVTANITIESVPDAKDLRVFIYVNGSSVHYNRLSTGVAESPSPSVTAIMNLTAGQSIEIWVKHNSGSARNIGSGNDRSYFMIQRLT